MSKPNLNHPCYNRIDSGACCSAMGLAVLLGDGAKVGLKCLEHAERLLQSPPVLLRAREMREVWSARVRRKDARRPRHSESQERMGGRRTTLKAAATESRKSSKRKLEGERKGVREGRGTDTRTWRGTNGRRRLPLPPPASERARETK